MQVTKFSLIKVLFVVGLVMACSSVAAQQASVTTYKKIEDARELIEADKNQQAYELLASYRKKVVTKTTDHVLVLQFLANILVQDNKVSEAISLVKEGFDQPKQSIAISDLYGKLLVMDGRFKEAVPVLENWIAAQKSPPADIYYTLAYTRYNLEDYPGAEQDLKTAMGFKGHKPQAWFKLLMSVYYQQGKYQEAEELALQLAEQAPLNPESWRRLAHILMQREDFDRALAALMTAHHKGLLSEKDNKQIINLHAYLGMPEIAARMMEDWVQSVEKQSSNKSTSSPDNEPLLLLNLKTYQKLGNYWLMARESDKAIAAYSRAEQFDPTGASAFQIANLYFNEGAWQLSIEFFNKALKKGSIDDLDQVNLMLGVSYFRLERYNEAEDVFQELSNSKRQKGTALYWLDQIKTFRDYKNQQAS